MKVIFIGSLPPIKGASLYCQELVDALSKHVEIEFLGFKKLYPDFLYPGGATVNDSDYKPRSIQNMKIRNILTYYNPFTWIWAGLTAKGDVVHAQWWSYVLAPVYVTAFSILKMRRKRIIITVHNVSPHEGGKLNKIFNSIVMRFADAFIVHDAANKEKLAGSHHISQDKIHVISHGSTQPAEIIPREKARGYLHIGGDREVILFFGNIREYKGLDVLLEAMSLVIKERAKAILLIAGQLWSGWDRYEAVIKEKRLKDHIVRNLDYIHPSEMGYYFSASDIVVLPYKYFDAQSGIGALALPYGKPVVVTRVGGLPALVDDENAVAEPGNAADLANRIVKILSDDKMIIKLSKDSMKLARKYSWGAIAQKTIETYDEVLKSNRY